MNTENTFMKFGFVKEENGSRLIEMIKNKTKLKEVHIDTYPDNPFVSADSFSLLLRTTEKNATILIDNDRLVLRRDDVCKTYFMNVLISKITECFSKISETYSEFILNIQNIYYRITIVN